jgi:hypothetical protein
VRYLIDSFGESRSTSNKADLNLTVRQIDGDNAVDLVKTCPLGGNVDEAVDSAALG